MPSLLEKCVAIAGAVGLRQPQLTALLAEQGAQGVLAASNEMMGIVPPPNATLPAMAAALAAEIGLNYPEWANFGSCKPPNVSVWWWTTKCFPTKSSPTQRHTCHTNSLILHNITGINNQYAQIDMRLTCIFPHGLPGQRIHN